MELIFSFVVICYHFLVLLKIFGYDNGLKALILIRSVK